MIYTDGGEGASLRKWRFSWDLNDEWKLGRCRVKGSKSSKGYLMTSIVLPPTHTYSLCSRLPMLSGHFHLVVSKVSQMYYLHNRSLDFLTCTCFLPRLPCFSKWLHFPLVAQIETWVFSLTPHSPLLPKPTPKARPIISTTKIYQESIHLLHWFEPLSSLTRKRLQ